MRFVDYSLSNTRQRWIKDVSASRDLARVKNRVRIIWDFEGNVAHQRCNVMKELTEVEKLSAIVLVG